MRDLVQVMVYCHDKNPSKLSTPVNNITNWNDNTMLYGKDEYNSVFNALVDDYIFPEGKNSINKK